MASRSEAGWLDRMCVSSKRAAGSGLPGRPVGEVSRLCPSPGDYDGNTPPKTAQGGLEEDVQVDG